MKVRLNARLRDLGLASRREADALIEAGKVRVNGARATLGMQISEDDEITVSGKERELFYEAYHKPRGLPTQSNRGEDSVVERASLRGLFPLGRLDKDSSGLLILTNDGRLATLVTGPASRIEKEYFVRTHEPIRAGIPDILARGMETEIGTLRPAEATLAGEKAIRITLTEGKRHQVRVMLAELGLTVAELVRERVGGIRLGRLRPGQSRALTPAEKKSLGL